MRNRVSGLAVFLLLAVMMSCGNGATRKAEDDFRHVGLLLGNHEYAAAMQLLDSMMVWNRNDFGIAGKALRKRDSIARVYHRQMIDINEELVAGLDTRIAPLKKDFILTPGEAGRPGTFEHRHQTVGNSWNRIFLKINLNERGEVWLTSHYYGQAWIDHVSIRVYDRDTYVVSDTIPLSDPWNRKVEDMGDKWETIDFREGTDAGILAWIADNHLKSIKVRFNGKSFQYIVLEGFDKEAIREGWELAQLLRERDGLAQTIEAHRKELRKLGVS